MTDSVAVGKIQYIMVLFSTVQYQSVTKDAPLFNQS